MDDFDDGVVFQLNLKKSDEEAVGALRSLGDHELGAIQHMAAFINFVIKNYHSGGADGAGSVAAAGPPGTWAAWVVFGCLQLIIQLATVACVRCPVALEDHFLLFIFSKRKKITKKMKEISKACPAKPLNAMQSAISYVSVRRTNAFFPSFCRPQA